MLKKVQFGYAMVFLGLCFVARNGAAQKPASYDYPTVPPIWIVEDDPNETIFDRKDLERDRKVGKMLVIPLYKDYQYKGKIDKLAIANPFVYQQGKNIEIKVSSFGQREHLRSLVFWVPGYFPDSIGRTFPWVPIIQGKRMIVLELQPCEGSDESKINIEMKKLLLNGDFVIEKMQRWKVYPPYSNKATKVNELYDIAKLVRSEVYEGRYFNYGSAKPYALWAFNAGTRIVNRLSPEETKTVAAFAAKVMDQGAKIGDDKSPGSEKGSVKGSERKQGSGKGTGPEKGRSGKAVIGK
jgi:hypothetical protein